HRPAERTRPRERATTGARVRPAAHPPARTASPEEQGTRPADERQPQSPDRPPTRQADLDESRSSLPCSILKFGDRVSRRVCYSLSAICHLPFAICHLLFAICYLPSAPRPRSFPAWAARLNLS